MFTQETSPTGTVHQNTYYRSPSQYQSPNPRPVGISKFRHAERKPNVFWIGPYTGGMSRWSGDEFPLYGPFNHWTNGWQKNLKKKTPSPGCSPTSLAWALPRPCAIFTSARNDGDSYGIPLAVQWVGSTPWFCKYKTGAWPSEWCPHKIRGTRPFQA